MFLFFKISFSRRDTLTYSPLPDATSYSFYPLNFLITTADSFIIYGLLFCLASLSSMMVSITFYGAESSHLLRLHLQLRIFSYSDVMKTLGFGQKTQKFYFIYLYHHLLHSIVDIMGKSLLDYIYLLHI